MFMSREEAERNSPSQSWVPESSAAVMLCSAIFTGDQRCWGREESN